MSEFIDDVRELRRTVFSSPDRWEERVHELCVRGLACIIMSLETYAQSHSESASLAKGVQFRTNGHISYNGQGTSEVTLRSRRTLEGRILGKLSSLPLPNAIAKQLRDLQQPFLWNEASVSEEVVRGLSRTDDLILQRNEFLASYANAVKHMHPDFAVFDTFRWHLRGSRKWPLLRMMHRIRFPSLWF